VIARHPYRAVGAVLAVFTAAFFLAGMIGQFNDGPWGGLPAWLGTASYTVTLLSSVALLALTAYLGVANLRHRRAVR
jgi:hypothetical protein